VKKSIFFSIVSLSIIIALVSSPYSYAQPYGKGLYGLTLYGGQTSLTISLNSSNVTIPTITPTQTGTLGTANNTVTVASTDVMGYKLYIRANTDTNMYNLGTPLATATFSAPGATKNVWGYNTDQTANFTAMALSDTQIYAATAPTTGAGHDTIVTYGLYLDFAKPAGNYTTTTNGIVYTAVPQTN
jgi:hypothetical protein